MSQPTYPMIVLRMCVCGHTNVRHPGGYCDWRAPKQAKKTDSVAECGCQNFVDGE